MSELSAFVQEGVDPLYFDACLIIDGWPRSIGGGNFAATWDWYPCRARIEDYSQRSRDTNGIPASDRRVRVLAGSIYSNAEPVTGALIHVNDHMWYRRDWLVIAAERSASGAFYDLQVR